MKKWLLATICLAAAPAASANFGLFRPSTSVRYYYCPPPVWAVGYPVYHVVPVLVPAPVLPGIPARPVTPGSGFAIPQAAPPSATPEPPRRPGVPTMPPAVGETSTSMKVSDSFYDLYPGSDRGDRAGAIDRCSIAFWNVSGRPITLRVEGRDWELQNGKTVTLELPRSFAWQVVGRESEATHLDRNHSAAEILIRR